MEVNKNVRVIKPIDLWGGARLWNVFLVEGRNGFRALWESPKTKRTDISSCTNPTFKTFLFVESPCLGQRKNQSNSRMLVVMVAMARAEARGTSQNIAFVVVLN